MSMAHRASAPPESSRVATILPLSTTICGTRSGRIIESGAFSGFTCFRRENRRHFEGSMRRYLTNAMRKYLKTAMAAAPHPVRVRLLRLLLQGFEANVVATYNQGRNVIIPPLDGILGTVLTRGEYHETA